jgi:acyl-CoA reductase-like NAD-dependent aldehyde dehydrogenase
MTQAQLKTDLKSDTILSYDNFYVLDRYNLLAQAQRDVPEAFDDKGRLLASVAGTWQTPADWFAVKSPIDGKTIAEIPFLSAEQADEAVSAAAKEQASWAAKSLAQRKQIITEGIALLEEHRDTITKVLAWEIGKTMPTAYNDVDRSIAGIKWYLDEIDTMIEGRKPLGLVSNIASWNYPFSVLMLNILVQALSGNSVIAKIPTQGGGISLTIATALLRRANLPVTLVGGRGKDLSESLVGHKDIAGLAFVGGRNNGSTISKRLKGEGKRYALEMEGVNAYVVTKFTDWAGLAKQIRAGFDFGKQRCTAYTRWVVERSLVSKFVEIYKQEAATIRVGNPLIGVPVDFGPLISSTKVDELKANIDKAVKDGAEILYQGSFVETAFTAGQDRGAYLAPTLLTNVPKDNDLYLREPFGPVDLLVAVDSEEEAIREANVAGGALVASVATDDAADGERIASQIQAYKVGINKLRSRGDKAETFGGKGGSWEGAFVGGSYLVEAFTDGTKQPEGNWTN